MRRPKRVRDWIGLKVKAILKIDSPNGAIKPGTEGEVIDAPRGRGLTIRMKECSHCGLGTVAEDVQFTQVNPLDTEENRERLEHNQRFMHHKK